MLHLRISRGGHGEEYVILLPDSWFCASKAEYAQDTLRPYLNDDVSESSPKPQDVLTRNESGIPRNQGSLSSF